MGLIFTKKQDNREDGKEVPAEEFIKRMMDMKRKRTNQEKKIPDTEISK
jgi:hypothetical protein